ncbi:unnamed protein product [Brassicogethes aeneus]|uniref:Uncharacterized protein n=1 Tax=Brassicogethes aeneus TaxID=1431903 RepID=A0A9P0BFC4_BRAAE|nr:unnamed protein product [Brassicogethes aeneus]
MINKWILLVCLTGIQAQDPRKRYESLPSFEINKVEEEEISCTTKACVKRSAGQDELGPFWANRGKKDPTYLQQRFFVEEPRWVLVRRDDPSADVDDPFFLSRGKKEELYRPYALSRERRDDGVISPFFAARGKKFGRYIQKI